MSEQSVVWEDTSDAGSVQCANCGSNTFELGVNTEGSIRISCADCKQPAAYCWHDDAGNTIRRLEPDPQYPHVDGDA